MAQNTEHLTVGRTTQNYDILTRSLSILVACIAGRYLGVFLIVLAVPAVIAFMLSNWYMKREKISYRLIKCIAWSNIITWIFPIIGIFTGVCTIQFGTHISKDKTKYWILAGIGITFALLNGVLGMLYN